jgi:shikimate dehydrogenase
MGMIGTSPVPINLADYYGDTIVFDMVYAPLETPLLKQARALGMRTIDGLEMLVGQAAVAFELFFGRSAPREYDAELRALLTS